LLNLLFFCDSFSYGNYWRSEYSIDTNLPYKISYWPRESDSMWVSMDDFTFFDF